MAFTKNQIQNQIYNLITSDLGLEDALASCLPDDPMRPRLLKERQKLRDGLNYWNNEHRRLTGHLYWQEVGVEVTGQTPAAKQAADAQQQRDKEKTRLLTQIRMLRTHLTNLKERVKSERLSLYENPILGFMLPQAGGGSVMNLAQVDIIAIPRAEKALDLASDKLSAGKLAAASAQVGVAAKWLDAGGARLEDYRNSIQDGGKNVETTIRVSTAVATGVAGSAATGMTVARTVGVEMLGSASFEGASLAAKVAGGEQISGKDLNDALLNVAISGSTAMVGEAGKSICGPLVMKLLGGRGNREVIETAVGNYFSANSKQLVEYVRRLQSGEKPNYDVLAALLAPAVSAASKSSGVAGGKMLEDQELRKSIADQLRSAK